MHKAIRIIKITIASITIFCLAVTIWLSMLDGKFAVQQSIVVQVPMSQLHQSLTDLAQWPHWIPWLQTGTNLPFTISKESASKEKTLSFQNILTGSTSFSNLHQLQTDTLGKLIQKVQFEKPFFCSAESNWSITAIDSMHSKVDWHITGLLPFTYRYLSSRMGAILELDMQRGLTMLKDYLETGVVESKVQVRGIVETPEVYYLGIKNSCISHQIDSAMQATFDELIRQVLFLNISYESTLACYYDFGINANKMCTYICAVRLSKPVEIPLPEPLILGVIKPTKALQINFEGDYKYLSNGWAAGLTYIRSKNINPRKRIAPFEIYIQNETKSSVPSEWKTELFIPVK